MMSDKLHIRFPSGLYELDPCHRRHFYEAMVANPDVHMVSADSLEHADFSFDLPYRQATWKIFFCRYDPHIAVAEIGKENLLDKSMVEALEHAGITPDNIEYITNEYFKIMLDKNPSGSVVIDADRYDIFSPNVAYPWNRGFIQKLKKAKFLRVPMAVPGWIFNATLQEEKIVDVFFLGAVYAFYPLRFMIQKELKQIKGITVNLPPSFTGDKQKIDACRADLSLWDDHQRWYADRLRESKITMFCGGIFNYPVQKYYEAMACGCLVFAPIPGDADLLGFKDGINMVAINRHNFMEKLDYYLKHDEERQEIITNALNLTLGNHTCEARAKILVHQLKAIKDGVLIDEVNRWSAV